MAAHTMNVTLVGAIYNNDHPSTPVVVGDLETLRASWSTDREDDPPAGLVVPDLESRGPTVFVRGDDVWLVAEDHDYGLLTDSFTPEELATVVSAPENEVRARHAMTITSGRLGVALAQLEGGDLPALPEDAPSHVELADENDSSTKALVAVTVPNGDYELTIFDAVDTGIRKPKYEEEPDGDAKRVFFRVRIRRAKD